MLWLIILTTCLQQKLRGESPMAKVRIRQRGKTWSYSFDAYTLEGKRKIVEKGGFQTKQIAYDEGVKAFAKYKGGDIRFSSDKITVVNFLNLWLEEKKDDLKISSVHTYKSLFATLSKFLGNVLLQELKPRDVNSIVKKLQKCGYSRETIHKHLKLLKEVLSYAVYPAELISVNPALFIKVPKNAPTNIIKREVISREKLDSILEDYPFSHPFHIPILLAYHTGMRLGEVLGLSWENVDLEKSEITVSEQLLYDNDIGYYFSTPKTETSYRKILLDSKIVSVLKKWKVFQTRNELSCGGNYLCNYEAKDGTLWGIPKCQIPDKNMKYRKMVCTTENGSVVKRSQISVAMRKHDTNFHSLRHTHATMLIEGNAIPKGVAARLGHGDTAITQNLYTHNTEDMQQQTIPIFEEILEKNEFC